MSETLIVLVKVVLSAVWLLSLTLFLTWVERKESAVIQDRIGANRASIFGVRVFGLFQPFADAIKMMFKEDFDPSFVRRFLLALAPFLSFFCVAVTIAVVPFGPAVRLWGRVVDLRVADLEAGIPFILAMLSLGVYGILVGGWASNNRFSLLGGMRGAAQLISYEVALGLSLVGLVLPSECISIEAGEDPDPEIQRVPSRYTIDLSRCCFCGFCVEACPEDAIRMDTGILESAERSRGELVYEKEDLLG